MAKANKNYKRFENERFHPAQGRDNLEFDPSSFDELEDEIIARESYMDSRPSRRELQDSSLISDGDLLGLYHPEVRFEEEESISDEEHYILQNDPFVRQNISLSRIVSHKSVSKKENYNG